MGMTLASITNDDDLLFLDQTDIGVTIIIDCMDLVLDEIAGAENDTSRIGIVVHGTQTAPSGFLYFRFL